MHSAMNHGQITPNYDYYKVLSCQWELDSVASFLQLSTDYVTATHDYDFFRKIFNWTKAVQTVLTTAECMTIKTYDNDGKWQHIPYTYCASYVGTPIHDCNHSPHRGNIGLLCSLH